MVRYHHQQGSVLLISLMLLIVLTLMTFTISNSVLLQEKMTGSNRDDTLAFEVAESALRDAELKANTFLPADYLLAGNQGLYDGACDVDDANCYLNDTTLQDLFDDANWTSANSREATTPVECPATNCPKGRYKLVRMGEVDLSLSGASEIRQVTNQYQDRSAGAAPTYFLYRVIATGTGLDDANRRVIVSHFAAPEL